ncbi:MAG: tripartite tricarboxylate transporter substrate binding protein [Betaproteobacteria bacterium]|nr:tripartite tricarboxylate transporter substrate binding protein [Betaproteobacteria bacterium]
MLGTPEIDRRLMEVAGVAAIAIGLGIPLGVAAQTFPNKPITLIVPTAPGGPVDVTARMVAPEMSVILKQRIVVDNRPGAAQKIGIQALLRAPNDGYTFSAASGAALTINPLIDSAIGYDPLKDFTLLTYAVELPTVLVINPSLPARSLGELIAHAKANPGKLAYGSGGNGTSLHFATEALLSLLGITALHVPYKSSAPALQGLLGGEINLLMPDIGTAKSHITAGKLFALASSGTKRSEELPNVPTYVDTGVSGLKGYDGYKQWVGFIAAAGIPQEAATLLQGALDQALRASKVRESLGAMGFPVIGSTPQQFAARLRSELESNKKMMDSGAVNL